jgi:hypothetical protein
VDNPVTSKPKALAEKTRKGFSQLLYIYHPRTWKEKGLLWTAGVALLTYAVVVVILGIYWSREPEPFDVRENALALNNGDPAKLVPGVITTATVIGIANTLLHKPGGYLSNDIMPPGVYLDDIPNWEFGVLVHLRDVCRALRNELSRAQTQSLDDADLANAQTAFNNDSEKWILPSAEAKYEEGTEYLIRYMRRLSDANDRDGQFYARADNLRFYLDETASRLGGFVQRLAASVPQLRINVNLSGDTGARQSTPTPAEMSVQTPWLKVDDEFYEARGYSWALLQMLKAIEIDFQAVLKDKNAVASLSNIIRELQGSQETVWSPVILNGSGFGLLANHSLILAAYLARANTAIRDLSNLLRQG